jgi:hypothetical protein
MQFRHRNAPCVGPSGLDRTTRTEWGARDRPRIPSLVLGLSGPLFWPEDCSRRA